MDGKLPQEVVGIADNRVKPGSLCISEFKIVNIIVKWLRKQTTRTKCCSYCREEEAGETGLSSEQMSEVLISIGKRHGCISGSSNRMTTSVSMFIGTALSEHSI